MSGSRGEGRYVRAGLHRDGAIWLPSGWGIAGTLSAKNEWVAEAGEMTFCAWCERLRQSTIVFSLRSFVPVFSAAFFTHFFHLREDFLLGQVRVRTANLAAMDGVVSLSVQAGNSLDPEHQF